MMRPVLIIAARMNSSRLPGKPLRQFAGRPLLDWLLARLPQMPTVLATSDREIDNPLAAFAVARGIGNFRGSLDDVAGRMLAAADAENATHFFRINGDSPCVEPSLIHAALREDPTLDLVTNLHPRTWPYGVACERVRVEAFRAALSRTNDPRHREHVTLCLYENLDSLRWKNLPLAGEPLDHMRLTVDTEDDARNFEALLRRVGDDWPRLTTAQLATAISIS